MKRLLTMLMCAFAVRAGAAERLNVVLILIDDLNHYGVTAYGANRISEWSGLFENRPFATPRIDRLAREGLRCDNAFAYPLCEPTRIALMSGQYNSRNFLRCKAQHASTGRQHLPTTRNQETTKSSLSMLTRNNNPVTL